jgi:hypothetical protein
VDVDADVSALVDVERIEAEASQNYGAAGRIDIDAVSGVEIEIGCDQAMAVDGDRNRDLGVLKPRIIAGLEAIDLAPGVGLSQRPAEGLAGRGLGAEVGVVPGARDPCPVGNGVGRSCVKLGQDGRPEDSEQKCELSHVRNSMVGEYNVQQVTLPATHMRRR